MMSGCRKSCAKWLQSHLIWWEWLGALLLGIAAGRAQPGGLPFFATGAAAVAPHLPERSGWPLAGGIIIGVLLRDSQAAPLLLAADLTAVLASFLIGRHLRIADLSSCLPTALLAGASDFLARGLVSLQPASGIIIFPDLISEAFLSGLFTFPLVYLLNKDQPWQKELRLVLLLVLLLCGFGDLPLGPAQLQDLLARLLILVTADLRGAGWGAGIGVVLGMLGGNLWLVLQRIGLYAGLGFLSGLPRRFGRYGVAAGFIVASLLLTICYTSPSGVYGHLLASFLAVGCYLLLRPLLPAGDGVATAMERKPLIAEVGFSQKAKPQEPLCGDTLGISRLEPNRLLMSVSDGMGTGINAARESRIVVKLLEQLLSNGMTPEAAANVINTALYLRGGEESAATIDLAVADLEERRCQFLKVGASPSFIKCGERVEMIRSLCWPAGILEQVDAEVLQRQITPGDILIMATDGVAEPGDELPGDWLYRYLQEIPVEEAQVIADLILKRALQASAAAHRDDMTVVVVRFCSEDDME